jgi:aminoglycoside phosphotransferase (APT) family kinase protein
MARMHADEVDVDVPLLRRLLAAQCPQWADLPIEPVLPWGTDNALFRLGDELVVRLPRRERTSHTLEKELQWLPFLAPRLPFAIPVPRASGTAAAGYPFRWAVYTWLNGDVTSARARDRNQLAVDLARFIQALQAIDASGGPSPGAHNFFRGAPLRTRDEPTRRAIASLVGSIDADAVTAAWERALRAPEWTQPPVWIHGDLDARNIVYQRGRLHAVLDFGGLGVGDPACDVMVAWKLLSPEARDVFRRELAIDDGTWARSRGWAVSQAVMALSYYTEETNPTLLFESRQWLREVLVGG